MGIEAFVWPYEGGEPAAFRFADVLGAFGPAVAGWDPEHGCLHLNFGGPAETCDVFCDKDAATTGRARGLMIARPVRHTALWDGVLRLLAGSHAVLFFSDDSTPRVWDLASVAHIPADVLASLGTPVRVQTPADILATHER